MLYLLTGALLFSSMRYMQIVSAVLSSKHQLVLPALARKRLGLNAGDRVVWRIREDGVELLPRKKTWTAYTAGLGKQAWQGVDPVAYINKLRDEWHK